jgi:hypothetical protein
MKRQNQCGAGMATTLRVRLLVGASLDAPAAEVDDLGRRTASLAVTLVVHAHALATPHAVDGLAELRRIDLARIRRIGLRLSGGRVSPNVRRFQPEACCRCAGTGRAISADLALRRSVLKIR